jgi:hypothetical protein
LDTPDLRDEANLPHLVYDLLAEGRAVIEAERREQELREEAAAGARRALLATNSKLAADLLVQLCPKIARLMPWVTVVENEENYRVPPEFLGMQFRIALPGFNPVTVWVQRRRFVCADNRALSKWLPWELGGDKPFHVEVPETGGVDYPSLGLAMAHAREWWLKANRDADVPF